MPAPALLLALAFARQCSSRRCATRATYAPAHGPRYAYAPPLPAPPPPGPLPAQFPPGRGPPRAPYPPPCGPTPPSPPAAAPPAPPAVYYLADSTGAVWQHADAAYLSSWVASRNADLARQAPAAPPL